MGTIGKVLVLVHGGLSLMVLAWVVGVVTHRIDWNNPPDNKGPGIYKQQADKAADYTASIDRAYNRWTTNLNQVNVLETQRYPRRAFYQVELTRIATGEPAEGNADPVRELVVAPDGFLDVNPNAARKAVEVRPGVKAKPIKRYEEEMAKLAEDILASQKKSEAALVERDKLNREILGTTQPVLVKGLRTLINEQKLISDQAENEDRYASVFVTNREAEFGLFKKRRDAMLGRVEELKAAKER